MDHEERGFPKRLFSVEQEGLAPGGITERKHLDLTIVDTPLGELKMYSSDIYSTSITCATATKHVQNFSGSSSCGSSQLGS